MKNFLLEELVSDAEIRASSGDSRGPNPNVEPLLEELDEVLLPNDTQGSGYTLETPALAALSVSTPSI